MHQSWKINNTIQTYASYVQMTRLMTTTIIIIIITTKESNGVFICVSKSSIHTNNKQNANNAHKYDCSSPKTKKNNEQYQKKVKKKEEVNVT